jgi:glycosyltransferase involved in cell wall biosynthesis
MRLLVATDQWFPDVRGGVARVATETAHRLAARGHAVTVLAPRVKGEAEQLTDGNLTLLRLLDRHGLPQTLTDFVETWRLGRHLPRDGFDVAVAHQSTTAAGLAWSGVDAPLMLVFHASAVRENRFVRSVAVTRSARLRLGALEVPLTMLERFAVRRATGVVVLSDFSRRILLEDHPEVTERLLRVSGGVDVSTFSPGDGVDGARRRLGLRLDLRVLFTLRRLEPRMGLETLIRAFALLDENAELVLGGTGSLATALQRLARELGLDSRVHLVGRLTEIELAEWYRAADLFVLPTAAYEGFGMVTVEALASGTPVVGTPVGATPELLRPLDPRLLARRCDAPALAETIRSALLLARGELRARARRYAEDSFSWETVTAGWEEATWRVASRNLASPAATIRRPPDD